MKDSEKLNIVFYQSVEIFAHTSSWPHIQWFCTANHIKKYVFFDTGRKKTKQI